METKIELNIKATSPCIKFCKASLRDQVEKIKEEVLEVEEALEAFYTDGSVEEREEKVIPLLMEMYDVIACVNTMHKQLEVQYPSYFSEAKRILAEASVLNKNMARGYYAAEE